MDTYDSVKKVAKINRDTLDLLLLDKPFQKDVKNVRKTLGISLHGFKNDKEMGEWYNQTLDDGRFQTLLQEVKRMLPQHSLSNNFNRSIMNYILTNDYISVPASNYAVDFARDNIDITIYQRPTKAEWERMKKEVNNFLDLSHKKKYNFLAKFNYPGGIAVRKPKPKLKKALDILDDIRDGKKTNVIEATRFGKEDEFVKKAQSKKNIANIKVIKHRLKKKGYI